MLKKSFSMNVGAFLFNQGRKAGGAPNGRRKHLDRQMKFFSKKRSSQTSYIFPSRLI